MHSAAKFAWTIASGAAGLAATQPALAAVIFNGGAPNQHAAYTADRGSLFQAVAVPFTLATGANTISGLNWWGGCFPGPCPTGDFIVKLYADSAGKPAVGTALQQWSVGGANQALTGKTIPLSSTNEYAYHATVPAQTVSPGTKYWLSFSNFVGGNLNSGPHWGMETTNPTSLGGAHYSMTASSPTWHSAASNLAFSLTGPAGSALVPEPASLTLLGVGLGGTLALRRRRMRPR